MQYAPTERVSIHKIGLSFLLIACLLAACGQPNDPPPPTLVALASMTPSITPAPSDTPTTTPSPTPTETGSPAPTTTSTLTPTLTLTPSATFTPSPTFTATPVQVSVFSAVGGYVRSGPGIDYDVLADVTANETFDSLAYAVDADGEIWYLIELESGIRGWISSSVAGLGEAELSQVALAVTVPASPMPTIAASPLPPETNALTSSEDSVNLRSGAGLDYNKLETLPPSEPLQIVGRNADGTWYQVTTSDQRQGWIMAEYVDVVDANTANLPVSWVEPVSASPGMMITGSVLPAGVIQQMQSVYQHGQALGNNPNSLITLGDSVDSEGQLFKAFVSGNYDLGQYVILQHTIDAFSSSGAFVETYLTSHSGFSFRMVLDPTWADPSVCESGETPLDCEYRRHKPSYAIIYLGLNDMRFDPPENFREYMTQVIQMLTGNGVIPIVTTFTIADYYEYAVQTPTYLQIMREVATAYQIPLVEFHEAAKALPNRGTGEDGAHLSFRPDRRISFAGDQLLYGETLRELLTLQMLDELRRYTGN